MTKRSLTLTATLFRAFRSGVPLCGVLPVLLLSLLLLACERRPLEVYTEDMAAVRVEVDWMDHFGMRPSGMTLMLYNDQDTIIRNIITNNVDQQMLYLPIGTYKMTIFNYSYEEFSSMSFEQLSSHYYAAARSNALRSHALSYWEHPVNGYIIDPEDIGVAVDTITITEQMLRGDQYRFADYRDRKSLFPDSTEVVFHEVPDPMTVTLYIKAKIKRRQSVKSILASISGMADGFYLSQIDRTSDDGTLYLPEWQMLKYGEERDSLGLITAQIATFGLPHGKELLAERDSTDNILTFHLQLTDGDVQDCSFNVGKDIRYITPTGREAMIRRREDLHDLKLEIDLTDVIVAPPKPPVNVGAGFDAWVDPWEDGGTIEFGM